VQDPKETQSFGSEDAAMGSASSSSTVWHTLMLQLANSSRPKPSGRLAQRIVDWTDVLYYVASRGVFVAALIQLVLHGPTVLHRL
jgi:hypothetical protein